MKNNKGFSLVELIIVIAIMAVLVGVMAPQYIKYVEKSRISTDDDNAAEILNAVKTALSDEEYITNLTSYTNSSITWNGAKNGTGAIASDDDDLNASTNGTAFVTGVTEVLDATTVPVKSTKYKGSVYTISVYYKTSQSGFFCSGSWS